MTLLNALTVDVEDYFQVSAFETRISRETWSGFECRVEANTEQLLDLFDRRGVRGTFFVLGWTAERFPNLVRRIHAAGHELGSHSYWHRLVYQLKPKEFREDLRQSRDVLQDLVGDAITAFRAPSFSITRQSQWALAILAEEGFRVDSSIFPIHHDRYGIPNAPRQMHAIETPAGRLWEFPASVVRMPGANLPVGGGGYLRLYPLAWTRYCLARINRSDRQPFVVYVHPWECDPGQPRLKVGSRLTRFRHYVNLNSLVYKLDSLLRHFRFGRLRDVVEQHGASHASVGSRPPVTSLADRASVP
jgi:polysaccharide deacetylase family protein (PEP-CTERM system associated)